MSTIKSIFLQHLNGTIPNATMDTNGNFTVGGTVSGASSNMFRNRIINGDMRIDQRNSGSSVSVSSDGFSNRGFPVDRWNIQKSGACVLSGQRTTNNVGEFANSIRVTVTTADSSVTGSDYATVGTRLEGYNISDMLFGSASAKSITLSFWVRSSISGTYYVCFGNYSDNRAYPARYTINTANTWEYKTVTLTADTTGTWYNDNNGGININWSLGAGSSLQGTANTWQGLVLGVSDQTQFISTVNATFDLAGVQFEIGSAATPFEFRPYTNELQLCQRYYYLLARGIDSVDVVYGQGYGWATTQLEMAVTFPVPMRTAPTVVNSSTTNQFSIQTNAGTVTFTNWSIYGAVAQSCLLYVPGISGLTAGFTYRISLQSKSPSVYVALSSEL